MSLLEQARTTRSKTARRTPPRRSPAPPAESNATTLTERAWRALEEEIVTLRIPPGSVVSEAGLSARLGLGRTPVREALMRMVSIGLIVQQPRRGLLVSTIDLADHLDVIQTRRVLEVLIAACSARRATAQQRQEIVRCAEMMVEAASRGDLNDYMQADRALDLVNHRASHNDSAVRAVIPPIVQCRRFWYAYQHEGEIVEGANAHLELAQGIATGDEAAAIAGADRLMDYLEVFARKIIDR